MASYKTYHYKTEWEGRDNIVITLLRDDGVQCGIIEVAIFKGGEHDGEALLWNLHVLEQCRGIGLGKRLLEEAYQVACQHNCHTAALKWSLKDSPRWVLQWYIRQGFDEKEFGWGYALLKKKIEKEKEITNYFHIGDKIRLKGQVEDDIGFVIINITDTHFWCDADITIPRSMIRLYEKFDKK